MKIVFQGLIILYLLAFRVQAWNPSNDYVPSPELCPALPSLLRPANALSPQEANYIEERNAITKPHLIDWFKRAGLEDFDPEIFFSSSTTPIGLSFSGGGYRAMLCGAGQFAALDGRTPNSMEPGHVGGLVQASNYIVGLSGGNWLVGSIVLNNFSTIGELQHSDKVWNIKYSLVDPDGFDLVENLEYWNDIIGDVLAKKNAGFPISFTDIWGRGLSHILIGLENGGPALEFSDIRNLPEFISREMPYPIHISDQRLPDQTIIWANSTIIEFSPYEIGSWDPELYSFSDIKYLGSSVVNGQTEDGECVTGFDNAGFIMGTSSSLFNQFILQFNESGLHGILADVAKDILRDLGKQNQDIAMYAPNPFIQSEEANPSLIAQSPVLTLVDGGEDLQNMPLYPLYQPVRSVDSVIAFDNSADTADHWPAGVSIIATYQRQFTDQANGTIFPYVPDQETFLELGLTNRPTFFGCHADNLTSLYDPLQPVEERHIPPVIVYVGNAYHSYQSNVSTYQLSYSQEEINDIIQNGYNTMSQSNGTIDSEWPACLGCAIIQREVERRGIPQTEQCARCFDQYCWKGELASDYHQSTQSNIGQDTTGIFNLAKSRGWSEWVDRWRSRITQLRRDL
jgi:lysophospholipase